MRFLVVDDSRAMQSIIKRHLCDAGHRSDDIKTANDGKQALAILREWKPNLVLTDWHMPIMDGMELMEKAQREMLDINIGFITTETSEQRIAEAKAGGALFVIQKPFEQHDLIDTINQVLANTNNTQEPEALSADTSNTLRFALPSANSFAKIVNALTHHEVLVEPVPPINLANKQLPCLVGLFDDGQSTIIRAICVLELPAACVLGAAIADLPTSEVNEAIAQKTIAGPFLNSCTQLLEVLSAAIYNIDNLSDLQLRSVNVVPKIFPKLESIYSISDNNRSDFEIAVQDFGQGLMTIITA